MDAEHKVILCDECGLKKRISNGENSSEVCYYIKCCQEYRKLRETYNKDEIDILGSCGFSWADDRV